MGIDLEAELAEEAEEERLREAARIAEAKKAKAAELKRKQQEFRQRKLEEKAKFEAELIALVGERAFKWWLGLPPARQRQQVEDWKEEARQRVIREEEERKAAEAAALLKSRTHKYPDGSLYVGDYEADEDGATRLPHGKGVLYWPDGKVNYDGEWHHGDKHGHGRYNWKNGTSWVGRFVRDEMHGLGTFEDKNGEKRQCLYQRGRRSCWLEGLDLGTRVEVELTPTRFVSGTIIRIMPGIKRLVKLDLKVPTTRIVDFGYTSFRLRQPRQAAVYLTEADSPSQHDWRLDRAKKRAEAAAAAAAAALEAESSSDDDY